MYNNKKPKSLNRELGEDASKGGSPGLFKEWLVEYESRLNRRTDDRRNRAPL